MNINVKLLQAFLLVAQHRSFRKAADASNRTTSAISMQLKQLEEQAGVALLRRTSHRVDLTPEGERLLVKVRSALAEIDEGLRELHDAAVVQRGLVTLASSPSIASTILPAILAEFGKTNPGVVVRVQELSAQGTFEAVHAQAVDFGLGPAVPGKGDLTFTTILHDELCLVVPQGHALAAKAKVPFSALGDMPCVTLSNFSALRNSLDAAAKEAGATLNIQYEVQQIPTLFEMVAAGLGVGIAPRMSLRADAHHHLRAVALVNPVIRRDMCIVTLNGRALALPAQQLVHAIHRAARQKS